MLLFSIAAWAASTVLLLEVHTPWAIFLAFFGLGAAQAGYNMSAQTMILEFGARDDLPMRIAVSATAESITATLAPLIGGQMADLFGYNVVFGALDRRAGRRPAAADHGGEGTPHRTAGGLAA